MSIPPMFKFICQGNHPDYDAPHQQNFQIEVNDFLEQGYRLLDAGHAKIFFKDGTRYGGYSWAMLVNDPRQEKILELEYLMQTRVIGRDR